MSDNGTVRYRVVTHPGTDADLAAIVHHVEVVKQRPRVALKFVDAFQKFNAKLHTCPSGYTKASTAPAGA